MGLVKSEQWKQLPTEGLYQVAISEVLDGGTMRALERGGGRALAVTAVLDLGLRMMESDRGRDGRFFLSLSLVWVPPLTLSRVQPSSA